MEMEQTYEISMDNIHYAGIGIRLKAFTYDYLLIFAYIIVLAGINYGMILAGGNLDDVSPLFESAVMQDMIAFITLVLPVILYFSIQESSPSQATWGKRKTGLRVIDSKGGKLSFGNAFLRAAIKFLPWQIAHTSIYKTWEGILDGQLDSLGIAGFILAYVFVGLYEFSTIAAKKHRAPYDWFAGSSVIYDGEIKYG